MNIENEYIPRAHVCREASGMNFVRAQLHNNKKNNLCNLEASGWKSYRITLKWPIEFSPIDSWELHVNLSSRPPYRSSHIL